MKTTTVLARPNYLRPSTADQLDKVLGCLDAAYHALRSYEHGNSTTALAKEVADRIEAVYAE